MCALFYWCFYWSGCPGGMHGVRGRTDNKALLHWHHIPNRQLSTCGCISRHLPPKRYRSNGMELGMSCCSYYSHYGLSHEKLVAYMKAKKEGVITRLLCDSKYRSTTLRFSNFALRRFTLRCWFLMIFRPECISLMATSLHCNRTANERSPFVIGCSSIAITPIQAKLTEIY